MANRLLLLVTLAVIGLLFSRDRSHQYRSRLGYWWRIQRTDGGWWAGRPPEGEGAWHVVIAEDGPEGAFSIDWVELMIDFYDARKASRKLFRSVSSEPLKANRLKGGGIRPGGKR